jgi:hypothetical protein
MVALRRGGRNRVLDGNSGAKEIRNRGAGYGFSLSPSAAAVFAVSDWRVLK